MTQPDHSAAAALTTPSPSSPLTGLDAVAARKGMSPRQKTLVVRIVQYVVFVGVVLAVVFTANWHQLGQVFARSDVLRITFTSTTDVTLGTSKHVINGLLLALCNTIVYSVGAFIIGLLLGTVLALMKLSSVGPYRWVATIYVELFRGLPALVVLLIFGMLPVAFPGLQFPLDPYGTVWLALGMVYAAYMSETIRAGIQAVPKGQIEAARTLGMPAGMATRRIVLPQAFRIITPPLTNDLVSLVKDSSLVYILGLTAQGFELTKFGRNLQNANANLTPIALAGLCYLVITVPLGFLVRHMENKSATRAGAR
ncbi:MAG: amino acid ABC transporter permease [Propionibacteriaceae bacterium]|nr:amino acid ABC transporter permease [Propionibacteriaceae bacterium]